MFGIEVHSAKLQNNKVIQLNLSHLSRGTYLVKVTDNNGFAAQRLVVVN
jgi:hypothetical protein